MRKFFFKDDDRAEEQAAAIEVEADEEGAFDALMVDTNDDELGDDGCASAVRVDTTGDGYADTIYIDEDGDGEPDFIMKDTDVDGIFDTTIDLNKKED